MVLLCLNVALVNAQTKTAPPLEPELQGIVDASHVDFQSPLANWQLTSPFGIRVDPFGSGIKELHNGIDLAVPGKRVLIHAAADGVVIDHWPPPGYYGGKWFNGHAIYGGCIILAHEKSLNTLYGHMRQTFVHEGQKIHKGDVIGIMGDTGYVTGPHLHLGVFVRLLSDAGYVDLYLDPMKTVMLKREED